MDSLKIDFIFYRSFKFTEKQESRKHNFYLLILPVHNPSINNILLRGGAVFTIQGPTVTHAYHLRVCIRVHSCCLILRVFTMCTGCVSILLLSYRGFSSFVFGLHFFLSFSSRHLLACLLTSQFYCFPKVIETGFFYMHLRFLHT